MCHAVRIWTATGDAICQRIALISRNKQISGKYGATNRLVYAHDDILVYFLQARTMHSLGPWKRLSCFQVKVRIVNNDDNPQILNQVQLN